MKDLELATTAEIINELVKRTTFGGIIIHSEEEDRGQAHKNFRLFTALNSEDSSTMLEVALDALAQQREQEHDGTQA